MAFISHLGALAPTEHISVEDAVRAANERAVAGRSGSIEEFCREFRQSSGLDRIAVIDRSRVIDGLETLLEEFFSSTGTDPGSVRYLVHCDLYNNTLHQELNVPHYLQRRFGLERATSFAIHQGCGSGLLCLHLASSLLKEPVEEVLLYLSATCAPDLADRFVNTTIMADGLVLMAISSSRGAFAIRGYRGGTRGQASFARRMNAPVEVDMLSIIRQGVQTVDDLLKDANVDRSRVKAFIPQNNHLGYATLYGSFLGIPANRTFLENIADGGHQGDADAIRNLKDFSERRVVESGDRLVLYGLGGPLGDDKNFNAVLLERC